MGDGGREHGAGPLCWQPPAVDAALDAVPLPCAPVSYPRGRRVLVDVLSPPGAAHAADLALSLAFGAAGRGTAFAIVLDGEPGPGTPAGHFLDAG